MFKKGVKIIKNKNNNRRIKETKAIEKYRKI
jgi:hypothetical protein